MKPLAFFDFDGTITSKDALYQFLFFSFPKIRLLSGFVFLAPFLVLHYGKMLSNAKMKQRVFAHFFRGLTIDAFQQLALRFCKEKLPEIIRKEAMDKIEWHKQQGHEIVVVSANFDQIFAPWCKENGLKIIGTCLESKAGFLTGKFASLDCSGEEKVKRIKQQYALEKCEVIYAYGDTKGDLPMLALAHYPFYQKF